MSDPGPAHAHIPSQRPSPGDDLGLGALVCVRASRVVYWVLALLLGPIGCITLAGATFGLFSSRPNNAATGASGVGLLLLFIAYVCVQQARTSVRFYELGVAQFLGRKPRVVIAWVEAAELVFKVVKQSYNGIPLGASVTIQIKTDDKRKISFTGDHKTKVKSRKLFGPKEVVAVDELDYVRDMVAEVIADRMADRLLAGEQVNWCGAAAFSEHGLTPQRGLYKRELVQYSDIDRESATEGSFSIYHRDEARPFLTVPMAAPNFWPGMVLLHRMIGAVPPEGAEEVMVVEGSAS